MDDRPSCKKCTKKFVPRLWHTGATLFTNMKTQHLCPYCGTVQYESGGGIRTWFKILLLIFFAPIILQVILLLFSSIF